MSLLDKIRIQPLQNESEIQNTFNEDDLNVLVEEGVIENVISDKN